jgi:ubiquinone/menaquinone biosynthesis C-methylase UbiE
VAKVYDRMAEEYDDIREPYFYNTYGMYDYFLMPRLEKAAGSRGFERVLDVGTGSGMQLYRLQRLGREILGFDISEGLVEKARDKFRRYPNIKLFIADATAIPLPDESVDCVSSYGEVYSHINNVEKAFAEVGRVLKPGGVFALDLDNKWHGGLIFSPGDLWRSLKTRGSVERDWEYLYEDNHEVTVKTWAFVHDELVALMGKAGLEIESFTGCHIFSSLLPYKYQAPLVYPRWFSIGRLGLLPELDIHLGFLDQMLGQTWPFKYLGFTKVIFARKKESHVKTGS